MTLEGQVMNSIHATSGFYFLFTETQTHAELDQKGPACSGLWKCEEQALTPF